MSECIVTVCHLLICTVSVGGSYADQRLEGFMLVAVPLNAQDETTAMGTFQVLYTYVTISPQFSTSKVKLVQNPPCYLI